MGLTFTFNLDGIRDAARRFLKEKGNHSVIALHGKMGAGKTTFVHACCDELHVKDKVGSPTYSLVNEYLSEDIGTIYHIDLYRVRDEEEARQAGIEEVLYSGALCFVEWPERAPDLFPDGSMHVFLDVNDKGIRQLNL
jgi:tRNA threonylcarbamoyladenosine biosynthesis protein TsaE